MRISIRTRVMRLMSEHTRTHMEYCTYTGLALEIETINQVNQSSQTSIQSNSLSVHVGAVVQNPSARHIIFQDEVEVRPPKTDSL